MKSWLVPGVAFLFVVLVIANPLLAHHGTSPYDSSKLTTVKGSVNTFEFINPHVEIYIDVKGDDGKIQKWVGEANSPNVLTRHGWSRDIIHAGDQITLIGNRTKNGTFMLRLQKVVLADGRELDPNSITDN
ncbi:MAG: hypothetical protein LAO08_13330 [Acidobacteriia bacterium]|nr:hypothetical protein [Terriglobia bacterium]